MKRMKHPLHGFHHAYSDSEEAVLRASGWVEDLPEPVAPQAPDELPAEPEPADEPRAKRAYTRRT